MIGLVSFPFSQISFPDPLPLIRSALIAIVIPLAWGGGQQHVLLAGCGFSSPSSFLVLVGRLCVVCVCSITSILTGF